MSVTVIRVVVAAPDEQLAVYGANAVIAVESTTDALNGPWAPVTSIAILSTSTLYKYADANGSEATWYRSRYESADGTIYSAWSDAWQAGAETGIVSLEDVKARLSVTDTLNDALLLTFIDAVTRTLDFITERQFVGDTADQVYLFDGDESRKGGLVLPVSEGIQSVTKFELASNTGGAYVEVNAADYFLQPARPKAGWPFTEIALSDYPTHSTLNRIYPGFRTVRVTGKRGFAAVPSDVAEIAMHVILKLNKAKQTGENDVVGTSTFGSAVVMRRISPEERAYLDETYRDWTAD